MEKLSYRYNCVNPLDKRELFHIIDNYKEITFSTFKKHIDLNDFKVLNKEMGYAVDHEKGLHIKDDWSVSYRKAKYKGQSIYFFVQSAIEYVFK